MTRPLLPHQKRALNYCRFRDRFALFMEMRLGKSKVVIERFRHIAGRVLIIAPLSTLRPWKRELERENEASVALIRGSRGRRIGRFIAGKRWNLINYEALGRSEFIPKAKWGAVVVDESSKIRNPQTQISKIITTQFEGVRQKAILSGTPAPESPMDYYQQFKFLHGSFLGFDNFWSFRRIAFVRGGFDWFPRRKFKDKIRNEVQSKAFILTRKDAGIANEKIREVRSIPLEDKQKKIMDMIEEDYILKTDKKEILTKWSPVAWGWLCRVAGGFVDGKLEFKGKMRELCDLLTGELKGEQVVVWFHYDAEISEAYRWLKKRRVNCEVYTGRQGEKERWKSVQDFGKANIRVLLVQSKVGLYSLDLSRADTAIYYSNILSNETRLQSEDRIEHHSKRRPLLILDLVTEDSVDEDLVKGLTAKKRQSDFYLQKTIMEGIRRRVA